MSSNGVLVTVPVTVTVSDSMSDDIYHDSWLHVNPRTFRNASHSFNVTNVWVANWKHNGVPSVPPPLPALPPPYLPDHPIYLPYHPLICPTAPSTCPTTPLSALPPPYLPDHPLICPDDLSKWQYWWTWIKVYYVYQQCGSGVTNWPQHVDQQNDRSKYIEASWPMQVQ